ncbi:MAG TPA: DUF4350 domain-containing protein [Blastocatellia bacterium]|jgi:hypothetical protein|nr:DUF4350 domain-containing protein [Blastocatellia bacterium]
MKSNASAILLVVALFAVLVALNFIFFVDTREANEDEKSADRSSYRTTPYGTHAFYALLEESNYPVTRLEKPFTAMTERDEVGTLVIISLPDTNNPDEEEFQSLNKWVESGGLLVIIDREIRLNFGEASATTQPGNPKSGVRPLQPTLYTRGVEYIKTSEYATRVSLDSRAAVYHIGDEQGALLADAKVGEGRVVLLTDPYVVANNGIKDADNVILALNLFADRPQGKIAFDEYHHGYGAATTGGGVMSYFRGTPVPWMMAQAGLIAALVVYTYGRRFARPIPLRRERRTTNLEFVSSMANITRLARASDLAIQNIYSEFRKRLCRFGALPAKVDNAKLAARAASRAKIDEGELARLLARCEEVARGEEVGDAELLRLVTRIREIEFQIGL